ncbi:MAG: potassium transporter Trk [Actinobacteria bacterium HGW-Actinobacteria-8]|nr:MAG: potassium transporter Trk [Actinobacteria bacterium HGW-Actinobacteria-8]
MPHTRENPHFPVAVIGGGQAGLAVAYELGRAGSPAVVLDAESATGDQWRRRWPSLRLFTPARHDGLPGSPFPAPRGAFPGKDDVAAYLTQFAEANAIDVRHGVRVTRLSTSPASFTLETTAGPMTANSVVVATGSTSTPHTPAFSRELDPGIVQLHSSEYRGPAHVPPGRILVVGYGTSGAEIAEELAKAGRDVTIAGRPTPTIPKPALAIAGDLWWLAMNRVLNRRTSIGRKAARRATEHGAPLIRISARDVRGAGAREVGRLTGAANGEPTFADGVTRPTPDVIIWCTGYRGDFRWIMIDGLDFDAKGYPVAPFGLPESVPGLAFLGMPFQTSVASHLLGGVGRDARDVATHLVRAGAGPA